MKGAVGSVLLMDSRLWHAIPPNTSAVPRVSVASRYAPRWLDSASLQPGTTLRNRLLATRAGLGEPEQPALPREVFSALPAALRPLVAHSVVDGGDNGPARL